MDTLARHKKPKIVVVVGPTSSGKSDLAVRLARKLNGEIIAADSRQVYRGLDIGSGKISKREMKDVRHHLMDVASPKRVFTAHDFVKKGRAALEDILRRGKTPIICGGTGFYIDALLGRIVLPDVPANPILRTQLRKRTASQLFSMLKKIDPVRAKTIDRHNPVRLIRAIEIAKRLGQVPLPQYRSMRNSHLDFVSPNVKIQWAGLKPDDAVLHKKIHRRLVARMKRGMVAEVKHLHKSGVSWKRLESFGLEYRWLARFLQKKVDKKEMLIGLERDIWRYAKRQITYWRRNKDIRWFESGRAAFRAFP